MIGIGAGHKNLSLSDTLQKTASPVSIEFGHDIIQQQDGAFTNILGDDLQFSQLQRKNG